MTEPFAPTLDESDIQGILLRERPTPYVGTCVCLRIDDPADGRRLLQRLLPHATPAARWQHPNDGAWLNVGLTYAGLQRLGLPQASLGSFAPEFRAGMAARAAILSDSGQAGGALAQRRAAGPAPTQDDPALGTDPQRRNAFAYAADEPHGLRCPIGARIRRANPCDELENTAGDVNIHRLLQQGHVYGPPLPTGVLDDDGVDRGIMFTLGRRARDHRPRWTPPGSAGDVPVPGAPHPLADP